MAEIQNMPDYSFKFIDVVGTSLNASVEETKDKLDIQPREARNFIIGLVNILNSIDGANSLSARGYNGLKTTIQAMLNDLNTRKVDITGDFRGTINGLRPVQIDPFVSAKVEVLESFLDVLNKKMIFPKKIFSKLENGENVVIVTLGDSTTEHNFTTEPNPNWVDLLRTYLQGLYPGKVTVTNSGVAGDDINEMWQRVYKDVTKYNPDMVIICSGLNDAVVHTAVQYKTYYKNVIEQILAYCGTDTDIMIRTPNNNRDINNSTYTILADFVKATEELANTYGLIFADFYTYQRNLITSGEIADNYAYYYDSIHPNAAGHQLIFDFIKPYFVKNNSTFTRQTNLSLMKNTSKMIYSTNFVNGASDSVVGGEYLGNQNAIGRILKLKFYGTGMCFHYTTSTNFGKIKITLDGAVREAAFDMYSSALKWVNRYDIDGLTEGEHTLDIEVLNDKNASSTNYSCFIHGIFMRGKNVLNSIAQLKIYQDKIENYSSGEFSYTSTSKFFRLPNGILIQSGFSSVSKNGYITFPTPFSDTTYNVVCTQSGGGGQASPTYEEVSFTGAGDYFVDKCAPKWNSADALKGVNWFAIGR